MAANSPSSEGLQNTFRLF